MSFMMRIAAPGLPATLQWFNTAGPLTLESLQGKVVILDFWTYCCINCMHVLPDLRRLEDKYADSLVVIGLHSPKHPNERVGEQVRKAVQRYDIRHAVAHDPEFRVWQEYGVRAWPTLVVLDAEGFIAASVRGEGHGGQLDEIVARLVREAEQGGRLRRGPAPVAPAHEPGARLRFPGKVHACGDRLAIADSGHHRVVIADHAGRILKAYGRGEPGLADGPGPQAQFRDPQGLYALAERLYVADTGNHAIRCIDLARDTVTTVAGTGAQGRYPGRYFEDPRQAPLNSPWDLAADGGRLLIAMAGPHQLWALDLERGAIGVYAGSGREDIVDGAPAEAAFAQPSGLALGDGRLYVADSETSAIRRVDLARGEVTTLVGRGLFEFGDVDGPAAAARLQHPLGVAYDPARRGLWIADSYNHKIKFLDIDSQVVSSLPLETPLMEPGGLAVRGGSLWIANTNLHQLVRVDLARGHAAEVALDDCV